VVDEYDGDTLSGRSTRTSAQPLTLGALEAFFDGAWSIFEVLEMNFGDEGYDLDRMLGFVVGVESQFYPQIGQLYEQRISAWTEERRSALGLKDDEDRDDGLLAAASPKRRADITPAQNPDGSKAEELEPAGCEAQRVFDLTDE
jgi:hypothetical protein